MRLISTEMVDNQMVLAKSIYVGDCLIMREGCTNISQYMSNLSNMGIRYVYVQDDKSENIEILDAIKEETRIQCKNSLNHTIEDFRKNNSLRMTKLMDSIEKIIADISKNQDVQVSLYDICTTDEYTFTHCVNTTVYALLIAARLKYTPKMMEWLAVGTILHDIGKILLDSKIMFKNGKLTDEEFSYVQGHAACGYRAIEYCSNISNISKSIICNHHEKLDGSGYPIGLVEDEIDEFSKIVAIADVYDALTSDRCYRKKWSTNKAVDFLIANSGTQFDADLVRIFIQQIAIYPNGSMVMLSDGRLGIVKEQNKNSPLRPIVRVIEDKDGKETKLYEVDMMEVLSLTITKSEIEIDRSRQSVAMEDSSMQIESIK